MVAQVGMQPRGTGALRAGNQEVRESLEAQRGVRHLDVMELVDDGADAASGCAHARDL